MKTLSEVVEDWDRWANSAGFDERNPDLQACIRDVKGAVATYTAERERAEKEHPAKEWAKKPGYEMCLDLRSEVRELERAVDRNDLHGEHGIIREALHVRIVAERISEEMERRSHDHL